MSLKYGFNIGTSDMKSLLEKNDKQMSGVRSWKQLFSGASQGYQAQNAALMSSYSDTIAEAYKANLAQSDAIASAGLNLGATRELIENNRAALHNAYQTYIQNYGKAASANAENYAATHQIYNDELTARAENFSKLYNYAYKYLTDELAGSTKGDTGWLTANNLDWLYDTELGAAKPWETLAHELFDENSAITTRGQEFFDAMFNAQTQGYLTSKGNVTRGFDQWLSDTDAKLRDWAVTGDAYNYTKAGTNFGTAKSLLGLESTDQSHSQPEYVYTNTDKAPSGTTPDAPTFDINFVDTAIKEYEQAEKDFSELTDRVNSITAAGGSIAATGAIIKQEKAEKVYREKRNTLSNKISSDLNTALTDFKANIGAEAYTDFMSRNETTYDELQNLLDLLASDSYVSPENLNRIKSLLETLNREFATEVKTLSGSKKSSGF